MDAPISKREPQAIVVNNSDLYVDLQLALQDALQQHATKVRIILGSITSTQPAANPYLSSSA